MAYIVGLLTEEEQTDLEQRGWEFEEAPAGYIDPDADDGPERMKSIWVDNSMFGIMTGPDWSGPADKSLLEGLAPGDEVTWNDPDEGKCSGVYKIVDIVVFGPEEECHNCHSGTLGLEEGKLVCRGECGNSFELPDASDNVFRLRNEAGSEVEVFGRELS